MAGELQRNSIIRQFKSWNESENSARFCFCIWYWLTRSDWKFQLMFLHLSSGIYFEVSSTRFTDLINHKIYCTEVRSRHHIYHSHLIWKQTKKPYRITFHNIFLHFSVERFQLYVNFQAQTQSHPWWGQSVNSCCGPTSFPLFSIY